MGWRHSFCLGFSESTLPRALHVVFQCSAPHLGGNFCTPKMMPWLLAQQSVVTKITCLASRLQHCWTDIHLREMKEPRYPLCCHPMVAQACPVGLLHVSLAVAWLEPAAFPAGAVFGHKGENAGIIFKFLTHIYGSREWVCHFSSIVPRLLHVDSIWMLHPPVCRHYGRRKGWRGSCNSPSSLCLCVAAGD